MSEYRIKLAGALPKEQCNGWDDASMAMELGQTVTDGHEVSPRVAVIVYDVKGVNVGTDGVVTVTNRVRRVQPVDTEAGRRALESLLVSEFKAQTGTALLPYEVESVTKAAFRDLPKTAEEIDQQEAEEQDTLSPSDELRRHLERVHGIGEALSYTAEESDAKHEAEHDGDLGPLAHDREWFGWTRAEIEIAASARDDEDDEDQGTLFPVNAGTAEEIAHHEEPTVLDHPADPAHEAGLFSHTER